MEYFRNGFREIFLLALILVIAAFFLYKHYGGEEIYVETKVVDEIVEVRCDMNSNVTYLIKKPVKGSWENGLAQDQPKRIMMAGQIKTISSTKIDNITRNGCSLDWGWVVVEYRQKKHILPFFNEKFVAGMTISQVPKISFKR